MSASHNADYVGTCPRVVGASANGKRLVVCGQPRPCPEHSHVGQGGRYQWGYMKPDGNIRQAGEDLARAVVEENGAYVLVRRLIPDWEAVPHNAGSETE